MKGGLGFGREEERSRTAASVHTTDGVRMAAGAKSTKREMENERERTKRIVVGGFSKGLGLKKGYKYPSNGRLSMYPKGTGVDHLSIYLDVADSATLPSGWSRHVQFELAVIDQIDTKTSITKVATHVFNEEECDWGFTSFLSLTKLHNPRRSYLVNDACLVVAYVSTNTTMAHRSSRRSIRSTHRKPTVLVDSPLVRHPSAVVTPAPVSPCPDGSNGALASPVGRRLKPHRNIEGLSISPISAVLGGDLRQGAHDSADRSSAQPGSSRSVQPRQPIITQDIKRALEKYGGEEELLQTNPGFNNTPFKIRLKKKQEEKEQKRKEKAEARLYTVIKVARNEDLYEQIGKDIYFDLVDHEKEEVAKEFGIHMQYQRFWLWAKRENHTYRPNRPLTHQEEAESANNAELKLFLEVELGPHLQPVAPPEKTTQDILLFFKLYDPYKEELHYIGRMLVKVDGKPMEILERINKMAGFDPDEEIQLYEVGLVLMHLVFNRMCLPHLSYLFHTQEIKFEPYVMCEHIDKTITFHTSQLEDGDIICLQKISEVVKEQCRYPDVPSFLEYVHNRIRGGQLRANSEPPPPRKEEFSSRGARGAATMNASYRVHVGNLPWGVDVLALETLFSEQGKVVEAKVVYDKKSGRSRGFGFVTYSSLEEVDSAIKTFDGVELDGRPIRASVAESRPRLRF
ncbi:hypothetical protein GQ457_09G027360 [Hibiscus cannabinus]